MRGEILAQCSARGPGKSVCPSEVARALSEDWRPLMPEVRRAAAALAREGRCRVLRKGREIDPETTRGPVRIAAPG